MLHPDIQSHKERTTKFYELNGKFPVKNGILLPHRKRFQTYLLFAATAALIWQMSEAGVPIAKHPLRPDHYVVPETSITELTFNDLLSNPNFMYLGVVQFLTSTAGGTWYDNSWNNDNNTVECIGGGGSGGAAQLSASAHATGGGGGAYSEIVNFAVTASASPSVTYDVGSGGLAVNAGVVGFTASGGGISGGVTYWNNASDPGNGTDNTKCSAAGGGGGQATNTTSTTLAGGTGGATTSSWGQTKYAGGAGGAINTGTHYSATGGGAPGITGTGGSGTNSAASGASYAGGAATGDSGGTSGSSGGGAGGAGTFFDATTPYGAGGGGGGNLGSVNGTVTAGSGGLYGAGGGASVNQRTSGQTGSVLATSGAGRQGLIVLTWTRKRAIIGS